MKNEAKNKNSNMYVSEDSIKKNQNKIERIETEIKQA